MPSREDADELFAKAREQNPGPWVEHCKTAARAAEIIARESGLDAERAYVSGLLHDIGYCEYRNGKGRTSHIYIGYELMAEKGYETIAKICLSHSFPHPHQDVKFYAGSDMKNCSAAELSVIGAFLSETVYDDYDKLIQLCDCLTGTSGVIIMEKRMMDVVMRHGFNDFTVKKWGSYFALKNYFDKLCGINFYNLFYDEITTGIFG